METRRLELLAELSRLGSMRAVADVLGTTTSTVSQQIAVLAREMGTPLIEPAGRRVRLTPAGRRLAEHAVTILAAVQAAQLDLGPEAEPNGTLRVAGFTTAFRAYLLPAITELTATHPRVRRRRTGGGELMPPVERPRTVQVHVLNVDRPSSNPEQ